MSEDSGSSAPKQKLVRSFTDHVKRMPRWHKRLLGLAILLTIVGASAQAYGLISRGKEQSVATSVDAPAGSRSLVSGADAGDSDDVKPTFSQRMPKWATRAGIGFIAGFVIGWIFRAFLKTMLLVSVLCGGLFLALSYFNILNLDLTKARTQYESGMSWVSDQGTRLKDASLRHIPSGVPALFGGFLGMRRK